MTKATNHTKGGIPTYVKPLKYCTGYHEIYVDKDVDLDAKFPHIKLKEPYVRTVKEFEPQELNFED